MFLLDPVESMKEMVNAFSDYARPPKMQAEPIRFDDFVNEALDLYRLAESGPPLEVHLGAGGARIEADPNRLRQVLVNLVKNAMEALEELPDGRIEVITRLARSLDMTHYRDLLRYTILVVAHWHAAMLRSADHAAVTQAPPNRFLRRRDFVWLDCLVRRQGPCPRPHGPRSQVQQGQRPGPPRGLCPAPSPRPLQVRRAVACIRALRAHPAFPAQHSPDDPLMRSPPASPTRLPGCAPASSRLPAGPTSALTCRCTRPVRAVRRTPSLAASTST